ncbi:MAG: Clp protease ClpP [Bacteroidales bacterium]|jgi:ATP-dependent protease ClpP protease subunit|nr:Clp protease ClpP [Bacteroidales bacterium]
MNKIHEIKLYGIIAENEYNCAERVVREIEYYKAEGYDIVLSVHSKGGDVIEGNMIAAAVARAGAVIRIDGLAASMAAFMLPYASQVHMVDNGFIMLHAPRFNAGGTAEELEKAVKQVRSIENDFVSKLMTKTGKDEDTVRGWLVGENWFTAAQALEMGLVDTIIPAIAPVEPEEEEPDYERIFARFAAHLITKHTHEMDKQQLIAHYGLSGVTAESSDAEVLEAIDAQLQSERTAREEAQTALAEEQTARQAAETAIATEREQAISAEVEAAITAKKITADKKDTFLSIGKSAGIEALKTAIGAIHTVTPNRFSAMIGKEHGTEPGSAWEKRMAEINTKNNSK